MKINIHDIAEHDTIKAAIEAKCADNDSIASGIVGPSYSCSGPGSGWSREYDTADYAFRALDGEYGATSYIDSDNGREATMEDIQTIDGVETLDEGDTIAYIYELSGHLDDEGWVVERVAKSGDPGTIERIDCCDDYGTALRELRRLRSVVWSDESVVEIILPTVEECLEYPDAWEHITKRAADYGADQDDIDALAEKVAEPYRISDGNAVEYVSTLGEVMDVVEDWYDYLVEEGKLESIPGINWPWQAEVDDIAALDSIKSTIRLWENEIAESMGAESWAGHGSYYVSAADCAGLSLTVSVRE